MSNFNFWNRLHNDFDTEVHQNKRFVIVEKISKNILEKSRILYHKKLSINLANILYTIKTKPPRFEELSPLK